MALILGNAKGGAAGGFYPKTIDQSLRFNDDDSAYLSRTPASAGNRKTFTWSGWVKRGNLGAGVFFGAGSSDSNEANLSFMGSGAIEYFDRTGGTTLDLYYSTSSLLRDPSAWYHLVLSVDTTQATSTDRVKIYLNGSRVTSFSSETTPPLNYESNFSNSVIHYVGRRGFNGVYFDGYLSEVHFVDGQALDATSFGEFKNGVWVAKDVSVTYGTNGFYLDFADGGALGDDESGNANDWTATNLASTDVMLDSPTNNFATLNPLDTGGNSTAILSQGNLKMNIPSNGAVWATMELPDSGKYYYEVLWEAVVDNTSVSTQVAITSFADTYRKNGSVTVSGGGTGGGTYTKPVSGDVMGVAVDVDSSTIEWRLNNTLITTTYPNALGSDLFFYLDWSGDSFLANFGQDSSFAGNKTPQGNTDANGIGDFYYAPPAGYLALCTSNLPEPAIGPNSATTSDEHFNTVLYTGNTGRQTISVGLQPDLIWIKNRSNANSSAIVDTVRGVETNMLSSDRTDAESDYFGVDQNVDTITSDGFDVYAAAAFGEVNGPFTYVAWNWKANGSGVSNTDGSITSTVSANTDAGFSIVSYTGTGSNATVGHGLSSAPDMVIVKDRTGTEPWRVWSTGYSSIGFTTLNDTTAFVSNSTVYTSAPTDSLVNIGTSVSSNGSSKDYIAYCFHSVDGFSKFGSYTGNGSTDGPFVYTGFRPAFVMVKDTTGNGSWMIIDNARDSDNVASQYLHPNVSDAEGTTTLVDFLSNGFKWRYTGGSGNASGNSYIYMAFAENPFKYSNAR